MSKRLLAVTGAAALVVATAGVLQAAPGATLPQQFDVYDQTSDGLQTASDPDTGNVRAVANPAGEERVIIEVHVQKVAPDCELTVELVKSSEASNGGLDETGHTGFIGVLGTLTTNGAGNGNAHFDFAPSGDGTADTQVWAHLDLEDYSGTCTEETDGTGVGINEYGAAPDPALNAPFTFMQ